ncbi:unnamed protein product [Vitrella brassicaformis CCMP3155]|uniref:non-specific serine/threonine protein kinase n=2 Tax=Vitrella brassicaformis TaxID=1169539 RepID=A0A0G4EC27_VITBC|nr:unnamed protein product [Vitrella brassicaformis CCMP3155]|eukprot:CEL93027.1 unnamed protein product [Vitrella brassicaformis CCMP3155]
MKRYEAEFDEVKVLGKGSQGKAVLLQRIATGEYLVGKRIVTKLERKDKTKCIQEIQLMQRLKHPLLAAYQGALYLSDDELVILMKYYPGGNMATLIYNRTEPFLESQVLNYVTQLLIALEFIHNHKVIHRNVKPSNVFVSQNDNICLGDLGVSRQLESTGKPEAYYVSPEVCEGGLYSFASDIWGVGAIACEMLTLEKPYDSIADIMKCETPLHLPDSVSPGMHALVQCLMHLDPNQRPTAKALLDHPLILPFRQVLTLWKDKLDRLSSDDALQYVSQTDAAAREAASHACDAGTVDWQPSRSGDSPTPARPLQQAKEAVARYAAPAALQSPPKHWRDFATSRGSSMADELQRSGNAMDSPTACRSKTSSDAHPADATGVPPQLRTQRRHSSAPPKNDSQADGSLQRIVEGGLLNMESVANATRPRGKIDVIKDVVLNGELSGWHDTAVDFLVSPYPSSRPPRPPSAPPRTRFDDKKKRPKNNQSQECTSPVLRRQVTSDTDESRVPHTAALTPQEMIQLLKKGLGIIDENSRTGKRKSGRNKKRERAACPSSSSSASSCVREEAEGDA